LPLSKIGTRLRRIAGLVDERPENDALLHVQCGPKTHTNDRMAIATRGRGRTPIGGSLVADLGGLVAFAVDSDRAVTSVY
jgi:hypothetical protein